MHTLFLTLIQKALAEQASDLYLLPQGRQVKVALFAQGAFRPVQTLSLAEGGKLVRYIKYRAQMDLGEQRRPQAGQLSLLVDQQNLHLRVSTVGDFLNQESLVIRLLYDIAHQGLKWPKLLYGSQFKNWFQRQTGLILIGGAIGTGKTSCMHYLAHTYLKNRLIVTIEDPVEIVQPDLLQLQVNHQLGMDYTVLIELALRHHPEVLMIGEIRNEPTALASIKAALSGHLVLATIHIQSVDSIFARLKTLGVPYQLAQTALTQGFYLSGNPLIKHITSLKPIE